MKTFWAAWAAFCAWRCSRAAAASWRWRKRLWAVYHRLASHPNKCGCEKCIDAILAERGLE